jgi:hypothetical protein
MISGKSLMLRNLIRMPIPGGDKVLDASGQSLAYVYGRETKADADIAKVLTMDEARRIASNIAKLATRPGRPADTASQQ